eukprot:14920106-Alexandrium_andersonii.AAC.1
MALGHVDALCQALEAATSERLDALLFQASADSRGQIVNLVAMLKAKMSEGLMGLASGSSLRLEPWLARFWRKLLR